MTRITVLTGGSTPERDVALAGAAQVVAALRARGYEVAVVDTVDGTLSQEEEARRLVRSVGAEPPSRETLAALAARELGPRLVDLPEIRDCALVFPVLHGRQGEGGELQAMLDAAGIPYAGSGALGSALAMDKDVAKRLFRDAGVPTPAWLVWPADGDAVDGLGWPVVVKPSNVGSTVGLTVVRDPADLSAAVEHARTFDHEVLLEAYAGGREFTVGILGDEALAVGEIIPQHEIFDYECKYTPGMTRELFPAEIPDQLAAELKRLALLGHQALKLRDFSRADFRLDGRGTPQCLEINTLPGLTTTSLLPQSAAAVGVSFEDLCDRICRLALLRPRPRNKAYRSGD
ncbi:MAG: D-alanine--D-alanine ligase [Gemmatimonadales bacterium]|jgi:D-alanine-D-alanine ligase